MMRRARDLDSIASNTNTNAAAQDESNGFPSYCFSDYELNSGDEDSLTGMKTIQPTKITSVAYITDPAERRDNATLILGQICGSPLFQPYLKQLLSAKDAQGQTPFMLAVSSRAYQSAKILLTIIQQVANGDETLRDAMIFPPGSSADQSPLYVLCCNDTCSFTWYVLNH